MGPGIRVVLADSSAKVRTVLRWLLEEDGRFDVIADFDDGNDAVLHARDADVVVTDIALRGIDGLTALARITDEHPRVAVVVYSSYSQPYLQAEARARGASAFIDKRAGYDDIADAVAKAAAARA